MTSQEAKRALLAYRSGTRDGEDPEMAVALQQAERDPELRAWLQAQTRFQTAIRDRLRASPVPAELRERILAERKIVRPLWARPEILLAAACLAAALVLVGMLFSRSTEETSLAGYRSRMISFALRQYRMDIVTNDLQQVRQFQQTQGSPSDYVLTPGLQATPVMGGASLPWQGKPVSMICFNLTPKKIAYMFVIDAGNLQPGEVPGPQPVFTPSNGVMTATWRSGRKVYFLAADADRTTLEKLAQPQG
jgi:hypothetical protein